MTSASVDSLIPGSPHLSVASGSSFEVVGGGGFPTFWRSVGERFHYLSHIDVAGSPLLRVRGTDRVVASLSEVDGGLVLLLPSRHEYVPTDEFEAEIADKENEEELWDAEQERIDKEVDEEFVDAILEFASTLRGTDGEDLPLWAERIQLPGESKAADAARKAADRVEGARLKAEKAQADLLSLRERKRLITATGRDLEIAVEKALVLLGCSVESGLPGRTDRVVRWGKHEAVIEVKGLSKSAGERDAAQLEKWATEHAMANDAPPKAILFINAWRNLPLHERSQPAFPKQMVPYATGRGHCLIETSQLLTAAETAVKKADKDAFLSALFGTVGVLQGWSWSDCLTVVAADVSEEEPSVRKA